MNCSESIYDVAEIRLFKNGVLSFGAPKEILNECVPSTFINGDVNLGIPPFDIENGEMKETPDRSVAGEFYKVVISYEIHDISGTILNALATYKKTTHDIITYSSIGEVQLVRSDKPGYKFTYYKKEGVIYCEHEIINISGAQTVVD
jgi:hypothetical protein